MSTKSASFEFLSSNRNYEPSLWQLFAKWSRTGDVEQSNAPSYHTPLERLHTHAGNNRTSKEGLLVS